MNHVSLSVSSTERNQSHKPLSFCWLRINDYILARIRLNFQRASGEFPQIAWKNKKAALAVRRRVMVKMWSYRGDMTLHRFSTNDKGNETKSHYRSAEIFPLSFSYAFLNKAPLKGNSSYTHFRPAAFSLTELIEHILNGRAFMPAQHKPFQRSNASFQCAQLLVLDFDNDAEGALPVSVQALQKHAFVVRFAAFI